MNRPRAATKKPPETQHSGVREILDALPVAVITAQQTGRITAANQPARDWFGPLRSIAELQTRVPDFAPAESWSAWFDRNCRPGNMQLLGDFATTTHGGNERTLRIRIQAFCDTVDPSQNRVVIIAEDVTDLVDVEHRLAVSQSMAAVGRLAARVAHELNNPLDGTLRYLGLCERQITGDKTDKAVESLREAQRGLKRMAQIVAELLSFSRNHQDYQDGGDINAIVEDAMRAMDAPARRNGVVMVASFRRDRIPAPAGSKLFQVCCNIIKNAVDAMPDGGTLTVTTGVIDDLVVIDIEDTGVGLPEPIDQVFEAFYTTKAVGHGTGLGLAICRDYIRELGGHVTARRGEPTGSVFTITLPLADRPELPQRDADHD